MDEFRPPQTAPPGPPASGQGVHFPAKTPAAGETSPYEIPTHRTFRQRVFSLTWKQWLRLAVICIVVGAILDASGIDPFAPDFTLGGAVNSIFSGLVDIAGWMIAAGWRPFLTGVLVVIPLWLIWRVAYALFRK
jgi:hypothetical protein